MKKFRRTGNTRSVKEILDNFLFKLPSGNKFKVFYLQKMWHSIMPEDISSITKPESIKNDVLIINSKTHEWATELNLLKLDIIKNIYNKLREMGIKIKDLYFKQGEV